MIDFHPHIRAELNKRLGQQSVLLLEIDWVDGGTITYSDRDFPGASSYLVSVGSINRRIDAQASNSIQVVLDATDPTIPSIFRTLDIHLRPARLYLGFEGLDARALLFEGVINSQVVYGEEDRTLQFEVLTKLEDSLVGFSLEDGYFPLIAPEDRAKVWPLPFGTVCHYPAQRVTATVKGFLIEGQGVPDPTLPNRICQIEKTQCPSVSQPVLGGFQSFPSAECLQRKRNEGCILKDLLSRQRATASSFLQVRGGSAFPQNQTIEIRVGAVTYRGVMNGEVFTIQFTFHPDDEKVADCKSIAPLAFGFRNKIGSEDEANRCNNQGYSFNVSPNLPAYLDPNACMEAYNASRSNYVFSCGQGAGGTTSQDGLVGGSPDSWTYYDSMESGRYIYLPAGTEVLLTQYEDDLVYVASLVPGIVTQVVAYRQFGDLSVLTQIPTDWYSIQNVNYGGYQTVEVRLNRLPSASEDPGWSDDIYVSFVSSVGPNPVNVIQWLIENYTDYTVDAANFAEISPLLTQSPVNFVVNGRPSVFSLLKDICYQSRLGMRVVDGVVSLVYLPKEPTSLRTLDTSDITLGSFSVSYSSTEDLATNHTITWRSQQTPQVSGDEVDQRFVMRFNIPKYGSSDLEMDWYTKNSFSTVYKASTFWLIRRSNTWKEISFDTDIKHLDLDVMDCVTINVGGIQFPTTKVIITEKEYDTENNIIRWKAWTPIRAGENSPYYWAWPATVVSGRFPLASESNFIGDGSGKVVIPPVGHPLRLGYVGGESLPASSGDPFPSDVGFVAGAVSCQTPLGNEVRFVDTPIIDALSKANFQGKMADQQASGVELVFIKREKKPCTFSGYNPCPPDLLRVGDAAATPPVVNEAGDPAPGCIYEVFLPYIVPSLIGVNCGGPCSINRINGLPCAGQIVTIQSTVNSYEAARAAITAHNVLRDTYACNANINVPQPYYGAAVRAYASTGQLYIGTKPPGEVCPDVDQTELDMAALLQASLDENDVLNAPPEWVELVLPDFDPLAPPLPGEFLV